MEKLIRINSEYINYFKTLDSVRIKDGDKSNTVRSLEYIYYDADEKTFVASNRKTLLTIRIENEEFLSQFKETSMFCKFLKNDILIAVDKLSDNEDRYTNWKRLFYDINGKHVERFDIPSLSVKAGKAGISNKYIPFLLCEMMCREVDCLYNPEFFDKVKLLLDDFMWACFSRIYTEEELDAMDAVERKKATSILPLQLLSADGSIKYLIQYIMEEETKK